MAATIHQLHPRHHEQRRARCLQSLVAAGGLGPERVVDALNGQLGAEFVDAAMLRLWTMTDGLPDAMLALLARPVA